MYVVTMYICCMYVQMCPGICTMYALSQVKAFCQYCPKLSVLFVCDQYVQVSPIAAPCQATAWEEIYVGVNGNT